MTTQSETEKPADEHEAWRAIELKRIRDEHLVNKLMSEPLCVDCLRRISICLCGHGLP